MPKPRCSQISPPGSAKKISPLRSTIVPVVKENTLLSSPVVLIY